MYNDLEQLQTIEYTILDIFPCAIENGDYSGLTDTEVEQLEGWLMSGNWCYDYGETEEFARCDITGLMGKCVHVTATLIG